MDIVSLNVWLAFLSSWPLNQTVNGSFEKSHQGAQGWLSPAGDIVYHLTLATDSETLMCWVSTEPLLPTEHVLHMQKIATSWTQQSSLIVQAGISTQSPTSVEVLSIDSQPLSSACCIPGYYPCFEYNWVFFGDNHIFPPNNSAVWLYFSCILMISQWFEMYLNLFSRLKLDVVGIFLTCTTIFRSLNLYSWLRFRYSPVILT
jgi:hypothetical protein